jgi:hypothetical protein
VTTQEYTLAQQPTPPPDENIPPQRRFSSLALILSCVIVGILLFLSGFFLGGIKKSPPQISPTPTPTPAPTLPLSENTPTPTIFSEVPSRSIQFLPGKQYFDDTYVVVSKQKPHQIIIISVARIEQQRDYIQYTKLNYFNGSEWVRKTVTSTLQKSSVTTNPLLRYWSEPSMIPTRNEKNLVSLSIENDILSFGSQNLQNEISVQSLPGSTKFIYQGGGYIIINNDRVDAYVLYSKTYSFNAADLEFLTTPNQITLDWIVFWDEDNTFYYVDSHSVPGSTSPIQNSKIGIVETSDRKVTRIYNPTTSQTQRKDVPEYIVHFDDPIEEQLQLPYTSSINKADSKKYLWILSFSEGIAVKREGRKVNGIGLFEFIRQQRN